MKNIFYINFINFLIFAVILLNTNCQRDVRVTGVKLDQNEITLEVGKSLDIKANVEPADAIDKFVYWKSSDPDRVSVENGRITGITATEGKSVTIRVSTRDGEFEDFCTVMVHPELDFKMVFVQGGTFTMGSAARGSFNNEAPVHQVTLSSYYIGKYPITQREWELIMGNNPSNNRSDRGGNGNYPVEMVSWHDVQEFIIKLNISTGKNYRLPTEAEWEYAARGGERSNRYLYSGSNNINDVAWYNGNSSNTQPIGQKIPNELGIYDMSGNVLEWCSNWYGAYTAAARTNPSGPLTGDWRVVRGGDWSNDATDCRVTSRYGLDPYEGYNNLGFRLVFPITDNQVTVAPLITITTQPASTSEFTENSITGSLSVSAGVTQNATLSYQWFSNTTNNNIGGTAILGATGSSFAIPTNLTAAGSPYYYFCEVTTAEEIHSVRSNVAMVIVTERQTIINPLEPEMVFVQGSTFSMGCTSEQGADCFSDEYPAHSVTLNSFYIGKYEITQGQWLEVMGNNPSHFTGNLNRPVEMVSWNDIVGTTGNYKEINGIRYYENGFIYKLNQLTGKEYRLPSEAEWEYAARGGNQSQGFKYSGSNNANVVAWHGLNSGNTTHPVGTRQPNELGIHDMSGNVGEWCSDWWGMYPPGAQGTIINPTGPSIGTHRVYRGGNWSIIQVLGGDVHQYDLTLVRVSYRGIFGDERGNIIGFRVVLSGGIDLGTPTNPIFPGYP